MTLRADTFGQGKSTAVIEAVAAFMERGMSVAGFTLVPIYHSTPSTSELVGFEAHLFGSGKRVLVAHNSRPDWFLVHFQEERRVFVPQQEAYRSFRVNRTAILDLIDEMGKELDEAPDVFIIDDLGPLTLAPALAHGGSEHPMVGLVRRAVQEPCPITILAIGQRQLQLAPFQACNHFIQQSPHYRNGIHLDVLRTTWRLLGSDLVSRLVERGAIRS